MKGLTFDGIHTYNNLSLILTSKTIGQPTVKTEYVEVLGADGQLDLTEAFGDVKYNNRKLTFVFSVPEFNENWATIYTRVLNNFHGKKMKIVLDDDPDYYYIGRVNVSDYASSKRLGSITIDVDAEPYKYKQQLTIVTRTINGTATVDFYNSRKTVIPKFVTNAQVQIVYNNGSYTIAGSGTHIIPNIIFKQGMNTLTFNGTATVAVQYQEGDL